MTERECNHLLSMLKGFSPAQLQRLRRELNHELANMGRHAHIQGETAFDLVHRVR